MSRLLKFYKPYIVWLICAFLLLVVQAQCDLALPDYMSDIVANGIAVGDNGYILRTGGIMLLLSLASATASVLVGLLASRIGAGMARDMRTGIFRRVSTFSNAEKTDATLRRALKDVTQQATVMIVAQRVGTIMNADQIIVLDEGKIVGKGTHKELLQTCEVYADIARSQLSEEELNR